jgi:hypothetical protein
MSTIAWSYLIAGEIVALVSMTDRQFNSRLRSSAGLGPYGVVSLAILGWPAVLLLFLFRNEQ